MNQYDFDNTNYPRSKYVLRARIVLAVVALGLIGLFVYWQ